MKAETMWADFITAHPEWEKATYEAWQFGASPDELADLVLQGVKTATASGYDLYRLEDEPLPAIDEFSVILNSQDEAVCVTRTIKVSLCPFKDVSSEHAYKEGEGDRSLTYWRQVHEEFFKPYYEEAGLGFSEDSLIVLEEFEKVYPLK